LTDAAFFYTVKAVMRLPFEHLRRKISASFRTIREGMRRVDEAMEEVDQVLIEVDERVSEADRILQRKLDGKE
jgi:hypothetical protein